MIRLGLMVLATGALAAGGAFAADGKAVYERVCAVCHDSGVGGAPKLGDKAAWEPRIKTGKPALVASVTKGKGAMPPKGGNAALSNDDIGAAVDFVMSKAKAKAKGKK